MSAASPRRRRSAASTFAPATISEAAGVRYLHLDTPWIQGAMRIAKPLKIELEYVQRMMVWMLLRPTLELTRGHAVQLGLGAAAITRFCHGVLRLRTTAVELNPTVVDACRLWFRLGDDSDRLAVLTMDAADYVADPSLAGSADVLCVDLYDHDAAAPALDGDAFYFDCHRLLADGGVMTVNLFGRDSSWERSAGRIAAAFGAKRTFALRPTREGNTIVAALKNVDLPPRAVLAERADNIAARFELPARKWLRMMRPLPASAVTGIGQPAVSPPPPAPPTR